MKLVSKPALCATSTAPLANSRNAGNTASSRGAAYTIVSVIPVSDTISGGMPRPGSTSVANSPTTSPPRTLTAPISVIVSSSLTPVVSRSNTTNVVARNGVPSSSKVSWPSFLVMVGKLTEGTDKKPTSDRRGTRLACWDGSDHRTTGPGRAGAPARRVHCGLVGAAGRRARAHRRAERGGDRGAAAGRHPPAAARGRPVHPRQAGPPRRGPAHREPARLDGVPHRGGRVVPPAPPVRPGPDRRRPGHGRRGGGAARRGDRGPLPGAGVAPGVGRDAASTA